MPLTLSNENITYYIMSYQLDLWAFSYQSKISVTFLKSLLGPVSFREKELANHP